MKTRLLFLSAVLLAMVSAMAQNPQSQTPPAQNQQTLPSAPSSVQFPKPTPPPAPPASEPKPTPSEQKPPATPQQAQPAVPAPAKPVPEPATAKALPTDPGPDPDIPTFVKRVDEVSVVFTVTDKRGRFVKDLKKTDFKVTDDNKPPVEIKYFGSQTDLPLRVGLLVDASNSVRDRFKFEQEAAIEFLNQIIRPKSDRGFVIGFDTTAEVTQDFTDSTTALSKGVRMLRPGGGTAMFDALYFACRDKLMKLDQDRAVRRAIILISDGNDNQSRATREEAIEMAQRAEVIVYTISTNVSGTKERGDKTLERIAEATGGRSFAPFKIEDVANAFSEIQEELRSQYAVAYKPADFQPNGKFRAINIVAENRKGLQVRARKGYYAPTQ